MSFWRIKLSKLFLRIPNKRLAVTATGLLLSSGAFVVVNNSSGGSSLFDLESFTRPVTFWRKMFPIYLDYRYTQWRIKDKNDEEQDDEYKKLHEKYAKEVVNLILGLRGIFIKLGQQGAMRSDIMPKEYRNELKILLDAVPGVEGQAARNLVEKAMQRPISEVFSEFDDVPLGAASIGQVHKARLKSNGKEVVVKIKYADSEPLFSQDMQTTKQFCRLAQPEFLLALNEMERQFMLEFDFNREAWALQQMRSRLLPHFSSRVVIPAPIMDLCNKNCIVMDFLPGVRLIDGILANYERQARKMGLSMESLVKMSTGEAVSPSFWQRVSMGTRYSASAVGDWVWAVSATGFNYSLGWILPKSLHLSYPPPSINKHNIMKTLLQVQGHQIFISRLFQGDPHLGNFILCPDGKIGLIDFGQVKEFSEEDVQNYATTLDLLDRKENDALVAHQIATGFQTVKNDPEVIYKTTVVLFDRDDRVATGGLNLQQFMEEMDKKDRTVKIPENFVFAVRASILLRGIAGLLGIEGVSMVNEWRYYFRKVIAGNGRV